MNIKPFALMAGILVLAACGNNAQDPEKLKGANFVSNDNDINIALSFDAKEMRAYGQVVNMYNAEYYAVGNKIKFGNIAATRMMGPTAEMDAEQEYFQFLSTVETYNLSNGRLTLKNADGKSMVLRQAVSMPDDDEVIIESVEVVESAN